MNVDYNTETQEITVELNTQTIELDTPTGGRGLKGDTGPQGPRGETGPAGVQGPIGETGPAGQDGYDGYSPIVSTSKSGKTTTVTITDADGEKTATILDGEDGVSPIITTSKSGKTTTITIVDADGTKTATILDGEDGASTWGSITGTLSDQTDLNTALGGKQETLVSGTNIKTINSQSLLGSGDITVAGASAWGDLTGDIDDQTDLKNALDNKVEYIQTQFLWTASENETQITTEQNNLLFSNNLFYFTWSDQYQIPHQYRSVGYYKDDVGVHHINFECGNKGYSFKINRNRYVTKSEYTKVNTSDLSTVATSGSYTDLSNKPTIPTKVSDLQNDSGFITSETDPVFSASASAGISSSDITSWDSKAEYINASFLLTAAENGTAITEEQSASLHTNNLFYIYDGGRYYSNGVYYTDGPPGFSSNIVFSREKKVYIFTIDKYRYVTKIIYNLQNELISGSNIKTVNNKSLLGYGNIELDTLSDEDIAFIASDLIRLEDMSFLFADNTSQTIDVSMYDTSITTDMRSMFTGCDRLTSLDLSTFDTANVTNMSRMFYDCEVLPSLDISNFNTSKVEDMDEMFCHCESITSLDLSNFNTSQVTDMNSMFSACHNLTTLDVSNFDTSSVTNMEDMFRTVTSMKNLDLSSFDTSSVTNMEGMFYYSGKIETLDISNFDFTNVTNYSGIFTGCGTSNNTPTIVYVKDQAAQTWILNLSSSNRPSTWTSSNVIIKGGE